MQKLRVSANGHYLIVEDGTPFFWLGDTAWKIARLTPEEYEVIQHHPLVGERIVAPISVLKEAAPLIRHHHEWFDGRGYPEGISGDTIPLESRILAVVDVADALRSARAYRPGSSATAVLAWIESRSGSQFDPELAKEFLRLVKGRPEVFP